MFIDRFHIVDLTHHLSENAPTWNGSCGFQLEIKKDYDREFRVHQIKMHAGVGTHMDAPSHRFQGSNSIDAIALDQLIVPACVIDVTKKMSADYEISEGDVKEYENIHGSISKGALVIGYTGWDRYWSEKALYRNEDKDGKMHFPAFSAKAVELLLKRGIAGIAIDTLSPDCNDSSFPVHKLILGAGKYIIENIANCRLMPAHGSFAIVLPLNIEATESPIRAIGLIPKG